jgi:hypothetical protein
MERMKIFLCFSLSKLSFLKRKLDVSSSSRLIAYALVWVFAAVTSAQASESYGAASFMKIGAGARATALGGAFVAVADDASAGYWNPAGLAQLPGPVISLADRIPVLDTDYASIALASPVWKLGFLGLNAIYYNCGNVQMYDEHGVNRGTLTDREAALIFSYAYKFDQLSVGASAKYVYQDMADDFVSAESDGVGADISILYKIAGGEYMSPHSLTVGAIFRMAYEVELQNAGADAEAQAITGYESPLNIRAGVHYRAYMGKDNFFSFMIDFDQTRFYPLKLHTGTELVIYDVLALRAGLDDLYAETKDASIDYLDLLRGNCKPTFGLGLKWKIGTSTHSQITENALIFDYALSVERLGLRHFFTLAYQF